MDYLTCQALSIGYAGTPIVEGITFSVSGGNAVFVVGENGTGKSTLLKTLLGLQPPLGGSILFSEDAQAGEVGYLPQKGESQLDYPASAWEIVLSGRVCKLKRNAFYSRADKQAARHALEHVGADDLKAKPFGSLSGGQQQRILLARALACEPKLLVLDEPTTGLDPHAAEMIYAVIDELRTAGAGVLAVSHDLSAAMKHATHILEMLDGRALFLKADAWQEGDGRIWTR